MPCFAPVNCCIYCGTTDDLRDEHIIPFGLNGSHVLPKSSCKRCADVTSGLELIVLRGELWAMRLVRDLQSRRSHRLAPKTFPIEFERNGVWQREMLPVKEHPVLLHFPVFSPPRSIASPAIRKPGLDVIGVDTVSFGPNPLAVAQRFGAKSIRTTQSSRPAEFARMIAKIAYSMASATGALSQLRSPSPLPRVILGEDQDIGYWVGTIPDANAGHSGNLHQVNIVQNHELGLLVSEVHLFCDSAAPRYAVVLGYTGE